MVNLDTNQFPYQYGDSTFTTFGIYPIKYTTINACDSTVLLTIGYYGTDTVSICENELPYIYGNESVTGAGNHPIHFTATNGLDSLIVLTLYVYPGYSSTDTVSLCTHELPYLYGDSTFAAAGDYTVPFTSLFGCDSIIYLHLIVNDVPATPTSISGDTNISSLGIYTYFIDPIANTDSYEWTISNPAWTGSRINNTLVLLIPVGGPGTISIQAVNECGKSNPATLTIHSSVDLVESSAQAWRLGQNIPNPANANTLIPYSIPNDGIIAFHLVTINGQTLLQKEIEIKAGSHTLELNTENLANGIYYYSMEYQGQRIVKKLTVQR